MLFHSFVRESTKVFWHSDVFVCFVLCLSHICNCLWQLWELFHGKLIRDESKFMQATHFGVITITPPLARLALLWIVIYLFLCLFQQISLSAFLNQDKYYKSRNFFISICCRSVCQHFLFIFFILQKLTQPSYLKGSFGFCYHLLPKLYYWEL